MFEEEQRKKVDEVVASIQNAFAPSMIIVKSDAEIIHKLSHQHLYIRFFELQYNEVLENVIALEEMMKLPFPIVIHNFIESNYL